MRLERRISAVYKDIPGGQLLGPTYDYTHRLLDFTLLANGEAPPLSTSDAEQEPSPHVFSLLAQQGLAKAEEDPARSPTTSPARRRFTRARARRACSS
jgi:alpha-D-ribose 1-methylphosphonate 5-triphosphate synthase subunit PhnI